MLDLIFAKLVSCSDFSLILS